MSSDSQYPEAKKIVEYELGLCPLMLSAGVGLSNRQCIGKDCMWWDEKLNTCSVNVIARALLVKVIV